MKENTVQDCLDLQQKFKNYCNRAEQHQFPLLLMIDVKMTSTIEKILEVNKVENQKDIRAMFSVVLKTIGEGFSEYQEGVVN